MFSNKFSWRRLWAVILKEFVQMKRDRSTFAMIIGIPLLQIILFGYAINTNPKDLPTALISSDNTEITRTLLAGIRNTGYFKFTEFPKSETEAEKLMATDKVLFIVNIPPNFTRDFVHNAHPNILVEVDATDPVTVSNPTAALSVLPYSILNYDTLGSLQYLTPKAVDAGRYQSKYRTPINTNASFDIRIQPKFNPDDITQYNTVPGLIGVVLTMTMVMITAIAITRERERGTMETLLSTPVQPIEVMIGKVTPYIIVGYIQLILIVIAAMVLFSIPIRGSVLLLIFAAFPFIMANLSVGLTMSTVASTQLQAMQMTTFFFIPSIILSGYVFPFAGMPEWAQIIGEMLPITHFIRIARGILLKGNGWSEMWGEIWPIFLFLMAMLYIGVKRYRRTLD